jgi:hypothetical protein
MLFIQAVTYNIAETDDGVCETLDTGTVCLAEPSTLARGESKCYWDDGEANCHYREPTDDLVRIVFVAIISALWSAPISIFVDWLIMHVLAAQSTSIEKLSELSIVPMIKHRHDTNTRFKDVHEKPVAEEVLDLNMAIRKYQLTLPKYEQKEFGGMYIYITILMDVISPHLTCMHCL